MKPWENGVLRVSGNHRYLQNGNVPFFWLGDTAWLIFANLKEQEAYDYLKNRAAKGFNVIQAVLVYATPELSDINKMSVKDCDHGSLSYWEHCDRVIDMAEELGMYMALLPSWGSLVKWGVINNENIERYGAFLAERYGNRKNIIWLLGGDIKAAAYRPVYDTLAAILREKTHDQLIGFHPFGRCSSTMWFVDAEWLDFNMFQSGHRRYDQGSLGSWDDNAVKDGFFGEDSWRYVLRDRELCDKPTLDGEPSYERILQGLHDKTQPYWTAKDVRRYAYWSVFAGACGHTYGDNSVMQFYTEESEGVTYGAEDYWQDAMHHEGSGQMGHLKRLMESVDFRDGIIRDDLLVNGQGEKYERIAVFAGKDFLFAYDYLGIPFAIDLSRYAGAELWYFMPATGVFSYIGRSGGGCYHCRPPRCYDENSDIVLVVKE